MILTMVPSMSPWRSSISCSLRPHKALSVTYRPSEKGSGAAWTIDANAVQTAAATNDARIYLSPHRPAVRRWFDDRCRTMADESGNLNDDRYRITVNITC